jgi:hypothetical protein
MKKIFLILVALSIFLFSTCKDDPVISDNANRVSRDYTWTIDTIQSGSIQTYMKSMWGSSSKNVWVSGSDADLSKCIYFFDGTSWSSVNYPPTYFIKDFYAVGGSSTNNVFFVGAAWYYNPSPPPNFLDSALVLQYTNGNWIYHTIHNSTQLNVLCIINENEIWAGGSKGNLLRYQGISWEHYYLGNEDVLINCIDALDANNVYASGHYEKFIVGQGAYLADYLYKFNGTQWNLIDSNIVSSNYNRQSYPTLIRNINGSIFGSSNFGFVKMVGDAWQVIKPDIYGQFNGTNENNIFLANQDFGVLHFNGKDWYRFDELPWLRYYDVEVFSDAVFLLATDGYTSYIVRGKLEIN